MKLNSPQQETLGGDLGAGSGQRLSPNRYDYYERQWRTQRGAWGDPESVQKHLHEDVLAVIDAFRERGTAAGLREAQRRGVLVGARTYYAIRAWTEEELAARLARLRAALTRRPTLEARLQEAFVRARLLEVREATAKGETPPQAVVDRPDVPRRYLPRWVTVLGVSLTSISVVLGVLNYAERRRRQGRAA